MFSQVYFIPIISTSPTNFSLARNSINFCFRARACEIAEMLASSFFQFLNVPHFSSWARSSHLTDSNFLKLWRRKTSTFSIDFLKKAFLASEKWIHTFNVARSWNVNGLWLQQTWNSSKYSRVGCLYRITQNRKLFHVLGYLCQRLSHVGNTSSLLNSEVK